jgi:DNA repair protein RecO (recombination protein O)
MYASERGKIRAVAKGVRKPQSRKAGHLEPFSKVHLQMARGRELDIITQVDTLEPYPHIRENLDILVHAAYIVELIDRFTVEEGESRPLFHLLENSLSALNGGDTPENVLRFFEVRLLELSGYRPQLFHCLECNREIKPEDQYFSIRGGGVVCPRCGTQNSTTWRLSLPALKVLRHYQRNPYHVAVRAKVSNRVHSELTSLMEAYLSYLLERKLNVPSFVREVNLHGFSAKDE